VGIDDFFTFFFIVGKAGRIILFFFFIGVLKNDNKAVVKKYGENNHYPLRIISDSLKQAAWLI
jgi:hypothetical protein